MKKIMAAALIAVLILGTCMRLVAASPALHILSADDDEHESEEGNINTQNGKPNEHDEKEEKAKNATKIKEPEDKGVNDYKDNDGDDVDDEKESREERKLEIKVSESTAKVESEIETKDMENEFEIYFKAERGISIELKYKNETERGGKEIEAELDLRVLFLRIVEYIDIDSSGTLTKGDTIIQTMDLTALSYTQPKVTTITSADGEAGYRFESVGTLNNFKFNITAVLFPKYALIDNTLVSPTETKITISITNFSFKASASVLALQVNAVSKMEIEEETEMTESEIKVKSDIAEGYFSWVNWAMVNHANSTVNHSFMKSREGTLINLYYPRGASIVHDPKLGVGIKVPLVPTYVFTLITPGLLIGTGITAIAIVAVAVALTRRSKLSPLESAALTL